MPRSAETAGNAMFTIVASRMTISTVTAMTARASQRCGYGSPSEWGAPAVEVGAVSLTVSSSGSRSGGAEASAACNVAACHHAVVSVSIVFISDTHVPKRARDLPHPVWAAVAAADVVVHAG